MKKSKQERNRLKRAEKRKAVRAQNAQNPHLGRDYVRQPDEIKRSLEADVAHLFLNIHSVMGGRDVIPNEVRPLLQDSARDPHRFPLTTITYQLAEFLRSASLRQSSKTEIFKSSLEWKPTAQWKPLELTESLFTQSLSKTFGKDKETIRKLLLVSILAKPITQLIPSPSVNAWPFKCLIRKEDNKIFAELQLLSCQVPVMLEIARATAAGEYSTQKAARKGESNDEVAVDSSKSVNVVLPGEKVRKKVESFLKVVFLKELLTAAKDKELGQKWIALLTEMLCLTGADISTPERREAVTQEVTKLLPKIESLLTTKSATFENRYISSGWSAVFELISEQLCRVFQLSISRKSSFSEIFRQLTPFILFPEVLSGILKVDPLMRWLLAATNSSVEGMADISRMGFESAPMLSLVALHQFLELPELGYRDRLLGEVTKLRLLEELSDLDIRVLRQSYPKILPGGITNGLPPPGAQLKNILLLTATGVPKAERLFAGGLMRELCIYFEGRIKPSNKIDLKALQPLLRTFANAFPGRYGIELPLFLIGIKDSSVRMAQRNRLAVDCRIDGVSTDAARTGFFHVLTEFSDQAWNEFLELLFFPLSLEAQKTLFVSAAERLTKLGDSGTYSIRIVWSRLQKLALEPLGKIFMMIRSNTSLEPQLLAPVICFDPGKVAIKDKISDKNQAVGVGQSGGQVVQQGGLLTHEQILRGLSWIFSESRQVRLGCWILERTTDFCIAELVSEEAVQRGGLKVLSFLLRRVKTSPAQERIILEELRAREANPALIGQVFQFCFERDGLNVSRATVELLKATERRLEGRIRSERQTHKDSDTQGLTPM